MTGNILLPLIVVILVIIAVIFSLDQDSKENQKKWDKLIRDFAVGNRLVFIPRVGGKPIEDGLEEAEIIAVYPEAFKLRYANGTTNYARYDDVPYWNSRVEVYKDDELIAVYQQNL